MFAVNNQLMWFMAGIFAALSLGSVVRRIALRKSTFNVVQNRIDSLKTWWLLTVILFGSVLFGRVGVTLLMATASLLAMREYLSVIVDRTQVGSATIVTMLICGTIHYTLAAFGLYSIASGFLPIACLIALSSVRAIIGRTADYLRITAGIYWGMMLMVYALSYSLFLFDFTRTSVPPVGSCGWFLFLVLLTESNDISQALVGRRLGKHKIAPTVSPNKSWEGLLCGAVVTMLLAMVLAPYLTTLTSDWPPTQGFLLAATSGALISVSGFLGDINMSAVKRDAGIKDFSTQLPGMGGVIDRINSLIFSAPMFYFFLVSVKAIQF